MNLFLIGYRCTGKTTIGRLLADRLNFAFLDTDRVIEQQTGSTISQIVETHGWEKFRHIEKKVLFTTQHLTNTVIATGGGMIIDPENQAFIRTNGVPIWLDADIKTILHRLSIDHMTPESRPSLTAHDLFKETHEVLNSRKPLYEKIAQIKIDTGCYSPQEIVNIIDRRLS
jgi:shikimate kinase